MDSSKKILLTTIAIAILVVLVSGVTFAFFNYTRTGTANTIKVGRISFVTNQTDTISLNNIFPIDPTETGIMDDETKVGTLEITIEGDTDYSDGIEYLVSSVDSSVYTSSGQLVPISLDVTVDGLGTVNPNYFTARDNTNTSIYKQLVGETLVGDQMLLVGYIAPNSTPGIASGIDGSITIKAYLDENKILISDTYDGTESDNMGTPNSLAQGKTVLTTSEWNSLQSSGLSFKVKVEANEGIWVTGSLEEIMRKRAVMDNINSDYVDNTTPGINFGAISSDTNGKGVYMRAGTQNDTYPILFYRGAVEDNNVLFNNKCWKAVRTTDTGGVKLIYNGEKIPVYEQIVLEEEEYEVVNNTTNNDAYIYTYDETENKWEANTNLINTKLWFKVTSDGYYTMLLELNWSNAAAFSIKVDDDYIVPTKYDVPNYSKEIVIGNLTTDNVVKFDTTAYYGGQTLPTNSLIGIKMFRRGNLISENGCNNQELATQITVDNTNKFKFNLNDNALAYVGYMYGETYTYSYSNWTSEARFGSSFTWDGTNYTLVDDSVTTPDATHHYSCNVTTENGRCQELRYVYYMSGNSKSYITLTGGDGIENALTKMQTNTNDSNAKDKIDTWYESQMTGVTNKLEDTIWCNDRSFGNNNNNGWIANGGSISTSILFGAYERSNFASNNSTVKNQPSLACINKNDAFTWKNSAGNEALDYPVGMITEDEIVLAGGVAGSSPTFYLKSGDYYWSLSPFYYSNTAYGFTMTSTGSIGGSPLSSTYGIRPMISIKPGQLITKGIGTESNPYVIE